MAFFKKKEEKKEPEIQPVSKNTREVPELTAMFIEEPTVIEPAPIEEEPKTILELVDGIHKNINVNELTYAKTAVMTDETIVREVNGKYEVIGIGPIEVKVISGSNDEVSLMMLDHMAKKTNLPDSKILNVYKYEFQNSETVKRLTGKTPAELNGITEEYFAGLVLKNDIDASLKNLPVDVIIEASKLPKDVQKILGKIIENVGSKKITAEAVRSLVGVKADETAILMKLLQF